MSEAENFDKSMLTKQNLIQQAYQIWDKLYSKTFILDKFDLFSQDRLPECLQPLKLILFAMRHTKHIEQLEAE